MTRFLLLLLVVVVGCGRKPDLQFALREEVVRLHEVVERQEEDRVTYQKKIRECDADVKLLTKQLSECKSASSKLIGDRDEEVKRLQAKLQELERLREQVPAKIKSNVSDAGLVLNKDSLSDRILPGEYEVCGTVTNAGRVKFSYVNIRFRVYDFSGKLVGIIGATTPASLLPGEEWKFRALGRVNDGYRYELHSLTGK